MNEFLVHHIQGHDRVGAKFVDLVKLQPIPPETPVHLGVGIPTSSLDVTKIGPGTRGLIHVIKTACLAQPSRHSPDLSLR